MTLCGWVGRRVKAVNFVHTKWCSTNQITEPWLVNVYLHSLVAIFYSSDVPTKETAQHLALVFTSIEARRRRASLLQRTGNGVQPTAFGQRHFGNGGNFANGLVLCYNDSICTTALPTIVLALLASSVNDDGCLEPWQARGSMLNDT